MVNCEQSPSLDRPPRWTGTVGGQLAVEDGRVGRVGVREDARVEFPFTVSGALPALWSHPSGSSSVPSTANPRRPSSAAVTTVKRAEVRSSGSKPIGEKRKENPLAGGQGERGQTLHVSR
jgi:hypothetical protein